MKKLKSIVSSVLDIKEEEITDETCPKNTESWDSFSGLLLISELENNYNIKFTMEEVMAVTSVKRIKDALKNHDVIIDGDETLRLTENKKGQNIMSKFQSIDADYFKERKIFGEKHKDMDFWHIADNWPLFSGYVNMGRSLAIYELLKQVINISGHLIELGTWNGANLMYMSKIIHLLSPHSLTEIYGFDSFEGLKQFSEKDGDQNKSGGLYKGNEEILREMIRFYQFENFVHLVKGNIENTLPKFLEERPDIMFKFVYIDVDLYSSTKISIELLLERLHRGGIMVFDEYNMKEWPGETLAVRELIADRYTLQTINFTRQPTAYFVKT